MIRSAIVPDRKYWQKDFEQAPAKGEKRDWETADEDRVFFTDL